MTGCWCCFLYTSDNYKFLHCYTFKRKFDPFSDLNFKSIHFYIQKGSLLSTVFKGLAFLCCSFFCFLHEFVVFLHTLLFSYFFPQTSWVLVRKVHLFLCFSQLNFFLQHNKKEGERLSHCRRSQECFQASRRPFTYLTNLLNKFKWHETKIC